MKSGIPLSLARNSLFHDIMERNFPQAQLTVFCEKQD